MENGLIISIAEASNEILGSDESVNICTHYVGSDYLDIKWTVWWRLINQKIGSDFIEPGDDVIHFSKKLVYHYRDAVKPKQKTISIKTNPELFNRITDMSAKLRVPSSMSGIVQNDLDLTPADIAEWKEVVKQHVANMHSHIKDVESWSIEILQYIQQTGIRN